jgi:diguanylate cyclase (GGDEF)-like protein
VSWCWSSKSGRPICSANEELSRLFLTDPLTGLANRRYFDQALEKECARITRTGARVSLISLDVDHFKALNDSQGHQKGDAAELARIAKRRIDVGARSGGEEFALILPERARRMPSRLPRPCGWRSPP